MEVAPPQASATVFECKPPTETSAIWRFAMMALVGAIMGGVGWFEIDSTLSLVHVAGWLAGGVAIFTPLAWFIERNPVRSFTIDDTGMTIIRANGTRQF